MDNRHVTFRTPRTLIDKVDKDALEKKRSRSFILTEILEKHYGIKPTTLYVSVDREPGFMQRAKKAGKR